MTIKDTMWIMHNETICKNKHLRGNSNIKRSGCRERGSPRNTRKRNTMEEIAEYGVKLINGQEIGSDDKDVQKTELKIIPGNYRFWTLNYFEKSHTFCSELDVVLLLLPRFMARQADIGPWPPSSLLFKTCLSIATFSNSLFPVAFYTLSQCF